MNALEIIYLCGAMAVGFIAGMIVELMIDAQTIRELQEHNRKLKLELAQSRKQPEIIEITDPWAVSSKVPEEVKFGEF